MNCLFKKLTKLTTPFLTLGTVLILMASCNSPIDKPHEPEINIKKVKENLIPIAEAVKMRNAYKTERLDLLKDTLQEMYGPEFEDTKTVWLDFETLKSYIAYVEKRTKEEKIQAEGFLFYFGVNEKSSAPKANHQTFFITPTTKKGNSQAGFTFENVDGEIKVVYLNDRLKNERAQKSNSIDKASFFNFLPPRDDDDGLILNKGTTSPPGE